MNVKLVQTTNLRIKSGIIHKLLIIIRVCGLSFHSAGSIIYLRSLPASVTNTKGYKQTEVFEIGIASVHIFISESNDLFMNCFLINQGELY